MAHVAGHAAESAASLAGRIKEYEYDSQQHYAYPETIGGQYNSSLNYNSHSSSEYAIARSDQIDSLSIEPFVLFEFMRINTDKQNEAIRNQNEATKQLLTNAERVAEREQLINNQSEDAGTEAARVQKFDAESAEINKDFVPEKTFGMGAAYRNLTGSIALYMPTDIQISDSIAFSEDSRKFGAAVEGLFSDTDATLAEGKQTTLYTGKSFAAISGGAGYLAGKYFKKSGAAGIISSIAGYGIGDIIQNEYQRSTGLTGNPNEFLAYKSTPLRSFTMNWKILPDSPAESKAATGLIEFFRVSAHAKKVNTLEITVPDHVVTSFHGAAGMIQIPPCYIESVNVTYNPNVSSFFKHGNAPVEVDLSVTFKEIVPIYKDDITKHGY